MKIKFRKSDIPFIIAFILGLCILLYPFLSNWYNSYQYKYINKNFDKISRDFSKEEIERRMKLARYYNDALVNPNIQDPFSRKKHEEGIKEYARMLQARESIGYIDIPKIGQSIPIYPGTSESVLQIGVGHLEFTSLPTGGLGNHCVLTAHTGLPNAKLFTDIRELKIGDVFFVHNIKEVLAYKVDNISVILPTDFSKLMRVPGKDYCTLLTCTPIMINTHRLLVRGIRTDYKTGKKIVRANKIYYYLKKVGIFLAIIVVALLVIWLIRRYLIKLSNKYNSNS